jgi:hypothetical protein
VSGQLDPMDTLSKVEMLSAMRRTRDEWEALLAAVGEARLAEPGVEGVWSVRDVLAHLTAYERSAAAQLWADLRGEQPTTRDLYGLEAVPPEVTSETRVWDHDQYNAWVAGWNRERPLAEVLADSRRAYERLLAAVEAVPEADFAAPGRFAWTGGRSLQQILPNQSFRHYLMHLPAIRAWLGRGLSSTLAM